MKSAHRANFDLIQRKYAAAGKGNVRLTPSTLYLTQAIAATKSTYSFDVLENQTGTIQANEIRLNQNDEFVITHLGVVLEGTFGIIPGSPKIRFTYAPIELGAAAGSVLDLFEGQMKIGVNNIVYLDKWDVKKCNKTPLTQYGNGAIATLAFASVQAHAAGTDHSIDGMIPMSPMLTLSGAKKNEIVLTLPAAITSVAGLILNDSFGIPTTIAIDRIGVRLFGQLAQNGAKFQ